MAAISDYPLERSLRQCLSIPTQFILHLDITLATTTNPPKRCTQDTGSSLVTPIEPRQRRTCKHGLSLCSSSSCELELRQMSSSPGGSWGAAVTLCKRGSGWGSHVRLQISPCVSRQITGETPKYTGRSDNLHQDTCWYYWSAGSPPPLSWLFQLRKAWTHLVMSW